MNFTDPQSTQREETKKERIALNNLHCCVSFIQRHIQFSMIETAQNTIHFYIDKDSCIVLTQNETMSLQIN